MSFVKWVSLALAVAIAGLTLALGAFVARDEPWVWQAILPASFATGLFAGAAPLALAAAFDREAQRLRHHIHELAQTQPNVAAPGAMPARFGLDAAADDAERALSSMRQRVTRLGEQRRELEVEVRVLEAERRHLQAILNSITDGVVVTDAFNEVALANGAAARSLGFDLDAAPRTPVERAVKDPTLVKLIKDTRAGGDVSLRRRLEHTIGHNGDSRVYAVTMTCVGSGQRDAAPVADRAPGNATGNAQQQAPAHPAPEGGGVATATPPTTTIATTPTVGRAQAQGCAGVVTILHDITREKEIAEMKSDFVSSVSHELRTPLSSIKAYMEMLVDGEANDEESRHEFYNIIQGETNRLTRLIDNILNISRIESGVVKIHREYIPLVSLIHEVVEIMRPQARAKDIELVEVSSPLYFQVFADRDMILQATMNLVGNAIKYCPSGGKVTASLAVDEQAKKVSVSVADTGLGIPAEDIPHLFDKFFRVSTHKKVAKGTGLGLNLVKHVVETVHGGEVFVTSEIDRGSTFTFALPIAENE